MVLDHLLAGMILQAMAYCWEERNEEVWLEEAQASFQMISNTKTHHQLHQQLKIYWFSTYPTGMSIVLSNWVISPLYK